MRADEVMDRKSALKMLPFLGLGAIFLALRPLAQLYKMEDSDELRVLKKDASIEDLRRVLATHLADENRRIK